MNSAQRRGREAWHQERPLDQQAVALSAAYRSEVDRTMPSHILNDYHRFARDLGVLAKYAEFLQDCVRSRKKLPNDLHNKMVLLKIRGGN